MCLAPPELGATSPGFVIEREGARLELSCAASGIPEPTLTWLKDSKELDRSPRVIMPPGGGRIVIKSVLSADAGIYTCLFKNPVAQVSHAIRVVVKGRSRLSSLLLNCMRDGFISRVNACERRSHC